MVVLDRSRSPILFVAERLAKDIKYTYLWLGVETDTLSDTTTLTPSNSGAEAVLSKLHPVVLHVAPPSSDVGAVRRAGLIVVPRQSLRRPVPIYRFSVGLFPVRRRTAHSCNALVISANSVVSYFHVHVLLLLVIIPYTLANIYYCLLESVHEHI